MNSLSCRLLLPCFLSLPLYAFGADDGSSINNPNVVIRVSIIEAPKCVVNNNQPVEVDFKQLPLKSASYAAWTQNLAFTLDCPGREGSAMKVKLSGSSAAFDDRYLSTTTAGLAISFSQGDKPVGLNEWIEFSYPNTPRISATPIAGKPGEISTGEFTAGATLHLQYE